jgi:hypothetical protein
MRWTPPDGQDSARCQLLNALGGSWGTRRSAWTLRSAFSKCTGSTPAMERSSLKLRRSKFSSISRGARYARSALKPAEDRNTGRGTAGAGSFGEAAPCDVREVVSGRWQQGRRRGCAYPWMAMQQLGMKTVAVASEEQQASDLQSGLWTLRIDDQARLRSWRCPTRWRVSSGRFFSMTAPTRTTTKSQSLNCLGTKVVQVARGL